MENSDLISFIGEETIKTPLEIDDLRNKTGEEVSIEGAIQAIRNLSQVCFLVIRTNRDHLQAVLEGDQMENLAKLQPGDFVKIRGRVVDRPEAYKQKEIVVNNIQKLSGPNEPLPINLGKKSLNLNLDIKLDQRVLTLRHLKERAIFRVQEGIVRAFEIHLAQHGFTQIHSPKIVKAGAEGGANIFSIDYFGEKAFLAQSPQFYKQFMVPVFGRVFEIGPVFRAEKHGTSRHLNEYTSLDFEMGFIDSFRDVMAMQVGFYREMIRTLTDGYGDALAALDVKMPAMSAFPAVRFHDAKQIVADRYSRKFRDQFDLEPEEERLISRYAHEELGSDFIFVTHYPWKKRPFYTLRSENPNYTEGFDLLFRGLEISTGGQRIHSYADQQQAMIDKGLNPADFKDYLELHKNGVPPHGGCGIGLERLTARLLNLDNVKEAA